MLKILQSKAKKGTVTAADGSPAIAGAAKSLGLTAPRGSAHIKREYTSVRYLKKLSLP